MANEQEPKRLKFQVEVDADKFAHLQELMLLTKKEFFNNALTILQWAAIERMEGRIIASIDKRTGEIKELSMPSLDEINPSLNNDRPTP